MEQEILNLIADLSDVLAKHRASIIEDGDGMILSVPRSREDGNLFYQTNMFELRAERLRFCIDETKSEDESVDEEADK